MLAAIIFTFLVFIGSVFANRHKTDAGKFIIRWDYVAGITISAAIIAFSMAIFIK